MAAVNRDPEVTRHLNRPMDDDAVAAFHGVVVAHWDQHGYGPWAIESREPEAEGRMVGFAGLMHLPPYLAAAGPGPELGWRLAREAWGRGLATEAATAARDDAFGRLGLTRLISIIHPDNTRSQRVATKLGLRREHQVHNPAIGRATDVWALERPGA